MSLRNVSCLGQQQGHRVFGGGDDVALRRVDHHDAAACRCFHIDVVETDPRATYYEQLVGVFQDLSSDLSRGSDDQCLRPADVLQQTTEVELDNHFVPGCAQTIETAFRDFLGNQDPGHCVHRYRRKHGFEKN